MSSKTNNDTVINQRNINSKNINKKLIHKIALRNFKEGKMKNIFIILAITLSIALLSGIVLFGLSTKEADKNEVESMQHVLYHNITYKQAEQLRNDSRISESMFFKSGSRTEIDNYVVIAAYVEQVETSMSSIKIIEGNYPKEYNEVVVDKSFMRQLGRKAVLNDTLEITFVDGTTEELIISGFTDNRLTSTLFSIYFSKEYAETGSQLGKYQYDVAAKIVDAKSMNRDKFLNLIIDIGADYGIERQFVNENNRFLDTSNIYTQNLIVYILIGLSMLLVSVMVIYSILYITIANRIRQYGQLRTLGALTKQIKMMVKYEGRIFFSIGAPIGLIMGIIFALVINPKGWSWSNTIITSIAVLIAGYITVMLSVSKPAKIAASVSPMEALKTSGYGSGPKKSKKLHRKISPLSLAVMSFKRNKKKANMTILSLGISGILFIVGATYMNAFTLESYSRQGKMQFGEFDIYFSKNSIENNQYGQTGIQLSNPINDLLIKNILNIEGIKSITTYKTLNTSFQYGNYKYENDYSTIITAEDMDIINSHFKSDTFDYDDIVKNNQILIYGGDTAEEVFGTKFSVGDIVSLNWYDGTKYLDADYTIGGIIDDETNRELALDNKGYHLSASNGWLIIPEDIAVRMMPEGFNFTSELVVSTDWSNNEASITNAIENILDNEQYIRYSSFKDTLYKNSASYKMIFSTIMGFCGFISLFSLINLINTLVTNVMSRKYEFAMLQSIGLSNKQLVKVIQGEGLYLAVWNIIVSLIFGSGLGYLVVKFLKEVGGVFYLVWKFPIWYVLIYMLVIIIVPIFISNIAINSLRKKSIVERLREAN